MSHSTELNQRLESLNSGSPEARDQLIEHSCERLRKLTRKMLKKFPKVRRWSDTDDVLQVAMMRLHNALMVVKPATPADYYGLAAVQIRRELIDLARHYYGAEGLGANHKSDSGLILASEQNEPEEPASLDAWTRFHEAVGALPDELRQVVDLVWYEGVSQPEAANVIGVSLATLKRRWAESRLRLGEVILELESG